MELTGLPHAPTFRLALRERDNDVDEYGCRVDANGRRTYPRQPDLKTQARIMAKIDKGALDPHCPDCGKRGGKCAKASACAERRRKAAIRHLDRPALFGRGGYGGRDHAAAKDRWQRDEYNRVMQRGAYAPSVSEEVAA